MYFWQLSFQKLVIYHLPSKVKVKQSHNTPMEEQWGEDI
jgi:hypothetical protein